MNFCIVYEASLSYFILLITLMHQIRPRRQWTPDSNLLTGINVVILDFLLLALVIFEINTVRIILPQCPLNRLLFLQSKPMIDIVFSDILLKLNQKWIACVSMFNNNFGNMHIVSFKLSFFDLFCMRSWVALRSSLIGWDRTSDFNQNLQIVIPLTRDQHFSTVFEPLSRWGSCPSCSSHMPCFASLSSRRCWCVSKSPTIHWTINDLYMNFQVNMIFISIGWWTAVQFGGRVMMVILPKWANISAP